MSEKLNPEALRALYDALIPFAAIEPSSFYPSDGTENEGYIIVLAGPGDPDFTAQDLSKARAALAAATAFPPESPAPSVNTSARIGCGATEKEPPASDGAGAGFILSKYSIDPEEDMA